MTTGRINQVATLAVRQQINLPLGLQTDKPTTDSNQQELEGVFG